MIYVFGAAFDPITTGHIAIIKAAQKLLKKDDKFYVLVSNTDEKDYNVLCTERANIVNATLKSALKKDFEILIQSKRMYSFLNEKFKDERIGIIVGEDEWNSLLNNKWVNSEKLLQKHVFYVVRRTDNTDPLPETNRNNVFELCLYDNYNNVSSSHVREVFYKNPATVYSEVRDSITKKTFELIKENKLYKQNSENYKNEEAEYLKKYAIMKKENGWGDPSVTVDIVAYNANKVLLIRRGNFPYKNYWAVPGGFFNAVTKTLKTGENAVADPDIDYAAAREFAEETTIKIDHTKFDQIKTYASMFDPRCRIVDVAFSVRVNAKDMKKAVGADDAIEAKWFDMDDLPAMAFHHAQIISDFKKKMDLE